MLLMMKRVLSILRVLLNEKKLQGSCWTRVGAWYSHIGMGLRGFGSSRGYLSKMIVMFMELEVYLGAAIVGFANLFVFKRVRAKE